MNSPKYSSMRGRCPAPPSASKRWQTSSIRRTTSMSRPPRLSLVRWPCNSVLRTGLHRINRNVNRAFRRSTNFHYNEDVHPGPNCDTGVAIWEFRRAQAAAASSILTSWIDNEPATRRPDVRPHPAIPRRTVSARKIQPRAGPLPTMIIRRHSDQRDGSGPIAVCWTRGARLPRTTGSSVRQAPRRPGDQGTSAR